MVSLGVTRAYDKLPRDELYRALCHAKVDSDLISVIMTINAQARLLVQHGGQSKLLNTYQGIR